MGFINIGGQSVHTSAIGNPIFGTPSVTSGSLIGTSSTGTLTISGTNSSITTSTGNAQYLVYGNSNNLSFAKTTYHVLGEDIQVDSYSDPNLAVVISTLNVLGKPFYDELKKNNITLPTEIEENLKVKFKVLERDRKIKDILKPN
jgi:hypothetical protein